MTKRIIPTDLIEVVASVLVIYYDDGYRGILNRFNHIIVVQDVLGKIFDFTSNTTPIAKVQNVFEIINKKCDCPITELGNIIMHFMDNRPKGWQPRVPAMSEYIEEQQYIVDQHEKYKKQISQKLEKYELRYCGNGVIERYDTPITPTLLKMLRRHGELKNIEKELLGAIKNLDVYPEKSIASAAMVFEAILRYFARYKSNIVDDKKHQCYDLWKLCKGCVPDKMQSIFAGMSQAVLRLCEIRSDEVHIEPEQGKAVFSRDEALLCLNAVQIISIYLLEIFNSD